VGASFPDAPGSPRGLPDAEYDAAAMAHLLAFLVRLAVSATVLWLAVAWVSPGNPANTIGRAVVVSVLLSIAYYITLARFLWFLIVPWLLYVAIWLAVVEGNYGLGFWRALLVAVALAFLSWVVSALFGIRTFRSG
jgi:putative membrane protein